MVIPGNPVLQSFCSKKPSQKDVLHKPFPFLSSEQAVFSCAREALLYGIKLLDHVPLKVHIPAYCCQSVLVPFEKLRVEIRFYDVDELLMPAVRNLKFSKGDIFLLIHYFGIPQDTLSINRLCQEFSMVLVEDCAHTLPDPEANHPMGSIGALSIYSLRKQLPVLDGGVLIVNDPRIKGSMISNIRLPNLRRMSLRRWLVTNFDRLAFTLGWPNVLFLKEFLSNVIDSTNDVFHENLTDGLISNISYITARVMETIDIKAVVSIRRKNYRYLADRLLNLHGVNVPFPSLPDGAVPQVFPLLLHNADRVKIYMHRKGIFVGRWPGLEMPKHVSRSDFPVTFSLVDSLLSLPLHQDLNVAHLDKVIEVLKHAIES